MKQETSLSSTRWPESVLKAALHEDYLSFLDKHREIARPAFDGDRTWDSSAEVHADAGFATRCPTDGPRQETAIRLAPSDVGECREYWARECGWDCARGGGRRLGRFGRGRQAVQPPFFTAFPTLLTFLTLFEEQR